MRDRKTLGWSGLLPATLLLVGGMLAPPVVSQENLGPPGAAELELRQGVEAAEVKLRSARARVLPVEIQSEGGSLSGYDPGTVELAAEEVQRVLLASLDSDELAALRAYVEASYPDPGETLRIVRLRGETLATRESTEGTFEKIHGLLARLKKIESLVVRLRLAVTPGEALVEMWPAALPARKKSYRAGDALTVYLGVYSYRIEKDGYWDIHGEVDLVENEGDTLDCQLYPKTSPNPRLPCGLR